MAVVGESGQGKSTMINLIMRFYDPDYGQVLIDGTDLKQIPVQDLRAKMGLVMQEPTLFNYTIGENILYGKIDAPNSDVRWAAQIANATEFIESTELDNAFEDNALSLHAEWTKPAMKALLEQDVGAEKYAAYQTALEELKTKEEQEGKTFTAVKNDLDKRSPE